MTTTEARAVTPTVRATARRAVPWIVLALIALLVVVATGLVGGRGGMSAAVLDPANAGPTGGRAVAEVLRQQGVDVRAAGSLDAVRDATTGDGTTLLVFDGQGNLDADSYAELTSFADTIVLVEPDFAALEALAPGVLAAGPPDRPSDAGCSVPAAQRAGRIDPRATANTEGASVPGTFRAERDAASCFRSGGSEGEAGLVRTRTDGRTVYLIGSATVLMNEGVDRLGNAALALNVLGEHRTLLWYLPGLLDRPVSGPPDLSELTPGWVTPVVLLLLAVFAAAAVWRGRRFGPLVVESLPVVVRASETREGRARLYQRSSARLRAADALRVGTIGRLAGAARLPRTSTAEEIAVAVAALTRRDPIAIRRLLVDDVLRTDAELIVLSDALAELEQATTRTVSPWRPGPTGRMEP